MNNAQTNKTFESPRQRAWSAMRKNREEFTIQSIVEIAEMQYEPCRHYVSLLVKAGYVQLLRTEKLHHDKSVVSQKFFKLIDDCGYTLPTITKKGERVADEMTCNKAMWNVLRITRSAVSGQELAALASTDTLQIAVRTAEEYLNQLHLAGYLKIAKKHSTHGGKRKYQLLADKNTGPKPLQIMRAKQVFDPNICATIPTERPDVLEELKEGTKLEKDHA